MLWLQSGSLTASLDGKAYEMALARTRQAVSVHQAMQLQRQGNPARYPEPKSRAFALTLL